METTPILIDHVLYFTTQNQNVVALDPETGKEIWKYITKSNTRESRGVSWWPGDGRTPPRILFGTGDGRLIALDAKTGKPAGGFGDNGIVDLRAGVTDENPRTMYAVSSPPSIYRDVVIVGPATQEGPSRGPSGDPRGFDARTGKLLWRFHTVPQPGETGSDTWGPDGWKNRSGPSQWGSGTVDKQRGMVFLPVGNAADSFYGADRKGTNLYANSVIALDALTGKLRWYFQAVHHDIWDYDFNAPPALIEVKREGKTIPAVAQISKMGLLFILDRETGKPVFGVEERPVPKSDTPGEESWPTQPFPVKPPPLARNTLTRSELTNRTPEARKFCEEWFGKLRFEGPYTPFGLTPSLSLPGTMGGGNWGGVSYDPVLGYIFVNTSSLGGTGHMVKSEPGSPMPYRNDGGYVRFLDQDQYPCQQPPWGELSAVNANTGDVVWRRPLGSYDELEAKGMKDWGATNIGGSIVTAGGLVFLGATTDSKFRAFDSRNGKELWVTKLEATAEAVPITYMGRDGRQYVVIAASGTNRFRTIANTAGQSADALAAFSLSGAQEAPAVISANRPVADNSATRAPLPEAAGKDVVVRVCTKCHGYAVLTALRMDRSGWDAEVSSMVDRGATGTKEELRTVVDYLSKHFAPRTAR
jgi:glucose dehydrogenase